MIRCSLSDAQRAEVERRLTAGDLPGRIALVTGLHHIDVARVAVETGHRITDHAHEPRPRLPYRAHAAPAHSPAHARSAPDRRHP